MTPDRSDVRHRWGLHAELSGMIPCGVAVLPAASDDFGQEELVRNGCDVSVGWAPPSALS